MADHRESMSRWSIYDSLQRDFRDAADQLGVNANRELERIMKEYVEAHPTLQGIDRQRQIVERETRKLAKMEIAAVQQVKKVAEITHDIIDQEIEIFVSESKGHRLTTKNVRLWAANKAKKLGRHVDPQEIQERALRAVKDAGIELMEELNVQL